MSISAMPYDQSPWSPLHITSTGTSHPFAHQNVVASTSTSKHDRLLIIGSLGKIFEVKKNLSGRWSADSFEAYGPEPGPRIGHAHVQVGKYYLMTGGRAKSFIATECLDCSLYILNLRQYCLHKFQDPILIKRSRFLPMAKVHTSDWTFCA